MAFVGDTGDRPVCFSTSKSQRHNIILQESCGRLTICVKEKENLVHLFQAVHFYREAFKDVYLMYTKRMNTLSGYSEKLSGPRGRAMKH